MKNKNLCSIIFVWFYFLISPFSFANNLRDDQKFDYLSYKESTISEIIAQWNEITKNYEPGFSILTPPSKVVIEALSLSQPFKCDTTNLQLILKMLNLKEVTQKVPMSHCVKIKESETTPELTVYIQDTLVESYVNEVKINSNVQFFMFFPAFGVSQDSQFNSPIFIISEFRTE